MRKTLLQWVKTECPQERGEQDRGEARMSLTFFISFLLVISGSIVFLGLVISFTGNYVR